MPTWQTSASSRSVEEVGPVVARPLAVAGDRRPGRGRERGVTALVCRRSGLTARATSTPFRQDTHGSHPRRPPRARPGRAHAARQPDRRPDPGRRHRRPAPRRRAAAQHPGPRRRSGRLPVGHREGVRPAGRRGLAGGATRLRDVRRGRRGDPAAPPRTPRPATRLRLCSGSTRAHRGSTLDTAPRGAAPGGTSPPTPPPRRTTTLPGWRPCAPSSPPTWVAPGDSCCDPDEILVTNGTIGGLDPGARSPAAGTGRARGPRLPRGHRGDPGRRPRRTRPARGRRWSPTWPAWSPPT